MVIRMRHTRAHTGNRRSHHALSEPRLATCANCGALHIMHRACLACGTYRGRKIASLGKALDKKASRTEEKAKSRRS